MNSSPITAWNHASAYFTFSNHAPMVMAILVVSIVLTAWVIVATIRHEKNAELALNGGETPAAPGLGMAAEELGAG